MKLKCNVTNFKNALLYQEKKEINKVDKCIKNPEKDFKKKKRNK